MFLEVKKTGDFILVRLVLHRKTGLNITIAARYFQQEATNLLNWYTAENSRHTGKRGNENCSLKRVRGEQN